MYFQKSKIAQMYGFKNSLKKQLNKLLSVLTKI